MNPLKNFTSIVCNDTIIILGKHKMNKFCNVEYSVYQIGNKKIAAELDAAYASLETHIRSKEIQKNDSVYRIIAIFYKKLGWDFKNPPIGKFVCGAYEEKQQRTNFHLEDMFAGNSIFSMNFETKWQLPPLPLTDAAILKKKIKQ